MLDNNLIIIISQFVLFDEYKNLFQTNKILSKILFKNRSQAIKKEYAIRNLKHYPKKLLELFNPIKLYNTPVYVINKYGWGDYIDFINISNFNNVNIIRGIDKWKRPFISFLYDKQNRIVTTIFQRYTEDKYRWVSGGPTPLGKNTIVIDFDEHYRETDEIKILIDFFNNN
uniref:Uncharacterized protein n=1 Tax=viral metagenome TaxID=1070528 RepID=A0A6C0ECJ1_9ZZZZ